jgi:hypothetical protein
VDSLAGDSIKKRSVVDDLGEREKSVHRRATAAPLVFFSRAAGAPVVPPDLGIGVPNSDEKLVSAQATENTDTPSTAQPPCTR